MACKECGGGNIWEDLGNDLCRSCNEKNLRAIRLQKEEEELQRAIDTGFFSDLSSRQIDRLSQHIVLTTAFTVARREIAYEIEIISAECAFGMNLFKDLFTAVRDVVGGRSKAAQNIMRVSEGPFPKNYGFYECLRLNSLELPSEVKGHVGRSVIAKDTTF